MNKIILNNINKYFGDNHVLKDVNLEIEEGDFMTFLGPSGCGKTTTLRVIVGLENPEQGLIHIDGKKIVDAEKHYYVPSSKRDLSLVFQSYALWPHMTVFENVSFGLTVKKKSKTETRKKVEDALKRMQILDFIDRYPSELSGGQQQRVAIARAIVTEPEILLLDEPLSNLDAKLRLDMRAELKRLHNELNTTIIYVTHDQIEALTLSTKIAVFFEGVLTQMGSPEEIYRKPADLKVADFIGNPLINLVDATCEQNNGEFIAKSDLGEIVLPKKEKDYPENIKLGIYPEDIKVFDTKQDNTVHCTVDSVLPAGSETLIQLKLGDETNVLVKTLGLTKLSANSDVWIELNPENINVYDVKTSKLL